MVIDMFKCPKCGSIVDEHDWTVVKIDESKPDDDEDNWNDGFMCHSCDTVYSGEELSNLVLNFGKGESGTDNYNPFTDDE
jgi:NAD-dependent dihydropyrimidine dehydrogenase PreA subunit